MWVIFAVVHLTTAAVWLGGMSYSLTVVQPKTARFFAGDEPRREEFLTTLAQGNRWKGVGLIGGRAVTGAGVVLTAGRVTAAGYLAVLGLYAVAAAIFANVSWRHWPARVFAIAQELPGYRRSLTRQAWAMLV